MGRYTIRRLLQMIPVIIGTTFIIYARVWALPGDPFAGKCGDRPCPAAYVAEMREKFNLDDPLLVQYFKYLMNLLQGNFGDNFTKLLLMTDAKDQIVALQLLDEKPPKGRWLEPQFFQDTWQLPFLSGDLYLTAGVRAHYWDFNREWLVSPRMTFNFFPGWPNINP